MPMPQNTDTVSAADGPEPWQEIRVRIPAPWKRWLLEAAEARGLSVAALVRQCIRSLMVTRHDAAA